MPIVEQQLCIPAQARDLEGFRVWARSDDFPETGRIDYLAGDIEVDMSPEDLYTHGAVKVAIAAELHALITKRDLGVVFVDRARISSPQAELSVEPDILVMLWRTLQEGRVREIPSAGERPDRFIELEGAADLVVEIVSDGSVGKDLRRLPPKYAAAGVPELWIVDARDGELQFEIRVLESGAYRELPKDSGGWMVSPLLGRRVRLDRRRNPIGRWGYRLEHRT
ncbi:MAG TPA: Uma2 family endonuclease [Thermoanaerobaculia bacterium]|nr:Uma2 family endonuclease [Thermoanaerobaculia bacterium]